MHANSKKNPLKVYEIDRSEVEEVLNGVQEDDSQDLPAISKLKEQLPVINNLEELRELLAAEEATQDRKGAISAIKARIDELLEAAAQAPELNPSNEGGTDETGKEGDNQETTKTDK